MTAAGGDKSGNHRNENNHKNSGINGHGANGNNGSSSGANGNGNANGSGGSADVISDNGCAELCEKFDLTEDEYQGR